MADWISVKDRLPKERQDVLLKFPSNMAVGFFVEGGWMVNSGGNWTTDVCEDDEVPQYWMPLPEPARVMTLEEIREAGDDNAIFIEYKLRSGIKLRPAIFQPDNSDDEYLCVVSTWYASGFYSCKTYNTDWRCWTVRPTDEQRKAVKWE